jgi:choline transport protein
MQVLISISIPSYEGTNWQASLLVIANVVLLYFVNVYGARALPYVQTGFAAFHLVCFVAVIAVLWARAPLASASDVFTGFVSTSGWPNLTLSLFVGQISAIWALIGSDCAAHMAEVRQCLVFEEVD